MVYGDILRVVPTIQAAALANKNLKLVSKKKKTSKDFLEAGVTTIVGATLIREQEKFLYD